MRASLIGAGLFAIVAVGCSGSKGDNLFGPGGTEVTGGGGSGAGDDDSSTGPGGSSLTGTGGGGLGGSSMGGSVGTGGASPGTGGTAAGTGGRGTAGGAGTTGTGGTVVRPDAGSAGTGGVSRPDAATTPDVAPPPVDAAPEVGGGGGMVVACGNEMCAVGAQQCCDTNNPTCVGLNAGAGMCPANAPRLRCDDGNDCPGAQVCCATPAGGGQQTDLARCTQLANCPAMGSQILCDPADPNACPRQGTPTCSVTQAGIFRNRPFCN